MEPTPKPVASLHGSMEPTPTDIVLNHVGADGVVRMGVLHGRLPAATVPEDVGQEGSVGTVGVGLYLQLLEDGKVFDVAYLSSLVEIKNMEEEEGKGEEEEEGKSRAEEKKEEESLVAMAKREEEEGQGSAEEEKEDKDEEDETESSEEEAESSEEEAESSEEVDSSEEEDVAEKFSVQIRIWLDSSHATLVLFDEGRWRLTRTYSVKWLSKQIQSCWLKGCLSKLDFEGPLLYSNDLEEIIKKEMNPTMDCFTINKRLGKGATSKVYECSLKKPSMFQHAVKIIKATRSYDINAYYGEEPREVQILSYFYNSTVVKLYQAWAASDSYESGGCLDEEGSYSNDEGSSETDNSHFDVHIHIHMEIFCRTLRDTLAVGEYTVDIEKGWVLFENIAKAVSCVHQKDVIHRDLKPENIFIGSNGKIKLGDFGDSCSVLADDYMDGENGTPDRGTDLYMAPELDAGKVSKKVDIYSLGIIYLEIFHPFTTGQQRYEVLKDITKNEYPINWTGDTDFLKKLTARSPVERASMEDIRDYIGRRG